MRFSILLPTRNRPEMLRRAVGSVLAQDFADWELIVFDNGETVPIFTDDRRVRWIRGRATGPADAFAQALGWASGEIVHPLGDDDELAPGALSAVDAEIGRYEWLVGRTRCTDEHGRVWLSGGPVDAAELERVYYLGGAVYWRRALSERLGGFDRGYDGAADFELYLRFARNAPAAFLDRVLYLYNDHPDTDSRRNAARQRKASARIQAA